MTTDVAEHNLLAFESSDVIDSFGFLGWLTVGEYRAIRSIAPLLRNGRVLDVGVGSGRTTSLLSPLTDDYMGVDYSEGMIELARRRFPEASFVSADVRDLRGVAEDSSVDVLIFSFNGLDSLSHDDRPHALAEMTRVLAPGGYLIYSTLNLHGQYADTRPWELPRREGRHLRAGARWVYDVARTAAHLPRSIPNYRAAQTQRERHDDWAMLPLDAHDFALVAHFTTLNAVRSEVRETGLTLERILTTDGRDITADDDTDDAWLQIVARKDTVRTPA